METYKIMLDTIICISSVAMGISAVVGVFHFRRHWRDDEPILAVEIRDGTAKTGEDRRTWEAFLRITNVGKVPVTIRGIEVAEDPSQKRIIVSLSRDFDDLLYQGAAVECYAFLKAAENCVALPERFTIRCKWTKADAKAERGVILVEP